MGRRATSLFTCMAIAAVALLTPTAAAYINHTPAPKTLMVERAAAWVPPTMDAVVVIKTKGGAGTGTGFSIGSGQIVTAAHVVDGAKTVSIKDVDGNIRMATVEVVDTATDLAILSTSHHVPAAELDCRMARVGEQIEAIGTPLGLEFITAQGRIAGAARKIGGTNALVTDIVTVMGQSGGPVFANGRVIGVTHAVMVAPLTGPMGQVPSLTGFGYIIPSARVCDLLARSDGEGA